MTKKRRCPEVLRRAYGAHRVRTLEETILSLISPPAGAVESCGSRCGRSDTSGSADGSFLRKDDDTAEYRELLTRWLAVVAEKAPPLATSSRMQRRKQYQIVRNTIEMVTWKSSKSSNVICSGYDKRTRLSPIVDLLSTLAWNVLLSRIGDDVMVHLLMFTSIFLPLLGKSNLQVTGPPVTNIVWDHLKSGLGGRKKRKVDIEDNPKIDLAIGMEQPSILLGSDDLPCSGMCGINGKSRKRERPFSWQRRKKRQQSTSSSENDAKKPCNTATKEDGSSNRKESGTYDAEGKTSKRVRLFSWQRCKRRRLSTNFSENNVQKNCTAITEDKQISNMKRLEQSSKASSGKPMSLQGNASVAVKDLHPCHNGDNGLLENGCRWRGLTETSLMMTSRCFCYLVLQAPQKALGETQIDKRCMFYNSTISNCSVFLRHHILNELKPNRTGAASLISHIFGVPDVHVTTQYMPYFHDQCIFPFGSECRYHFLRHLFKTLIRNAQRCRYVKLLAKHCSLPGLTLSRSKGGDFISEGLKAHIDLSLFHFCTVKKKYNWFHLSPSNLSLEEAYGNVYKGQELQKKTPKVSSDQQFELNGAFCKNKQVVSFIWAICRSIVPLDLLGAPHNWRALRRNIAKFVQLRRFEKFYLKQCVYGLKTSGFPFLSMDTHSFCCFSELAIRDRFQKSSHLCHKELVGAKVTLQRKLFEKWIYWFFSFLVVPIIRTHFYVTESETGKQDIFYYRKPIWKKLMNRAISCLKERNYRLLDSASLSNILWGRVKRPFGFSKVRFLPKEKGVRPIANLKAQSKLSVAIVKKSSKNCYGRMDKISAGMWKSRSKSESLVFFKSVNSALRDLYAILNRVKVENPDKLGASVFDYNDVYKQLCPFLSGLRNGYKAMPRVFIVVCDVSKAFDSVDQDQLLTVMNDVLNKDEYLLKRYAKILCSKKTLVIRYDHASIDQSCNDDIIKSATSFPLGSLQGVLVDQVSSKKIKQEEICYLLNEHVKRNVLQIGPDFYLQKVGIPQGSVLSSLLCSFYYGHLERNVIFPLLEKVHEPSMFGFENIGEQSPSLDKELYSTCSCLEADRGNRCLGGLKTVPLKKKNILFPGEECGFQNEDASSRFISGAVGENSSSPSHMLVRLIDDFLFISTSEKEAACLFSRLQRGFREYNCSMNDGKFGLNFDTGVGLQPEISPNRVYIGEDGVSFLPWSGLLINCCTLEIQADYTRYWGTHMRSTLTVWGQAKPGYHLKEKLCDYMRPKCHPLFYDSNINSPAIVRLNAYQAFLLCAMKFHCYVCAMPNIKSLSPDYYMEIIGRSLSYMYKLIKKRMHSMRLSTNLSPVLHLKKDEVEWLGLNAYIWVLRKKQSCHAGLLSRLRLKVGRYGDISNMSCDLKYAVDDSHSSMFWKIKY